MKTALAVCLAAALLTVPTYAAEPPAKAPAAAPTGAPKITVQEAINVGLALRRLTSYVATENGKPIMNGGQPVLMAYGSDRPSPYRFGGDVLFAMSVNLQQADLALKNFQETTTALTKQVYGSAEKKAEADKADQDPLRATYSAELEKAFVADSRTLMVKIKRSSLCLEVAAPKCDQANPIPLDVLSLLLPIIERD